MARAPGKHGRDQALDFHGFLNDLQGWELSLEDNDKRMKAQSSAKSTGGDRKPTGRSAALDSSRSNSKERGFSKSFDAIDRISSNLVAEESPPDAVSEKELGNEYFKQKKFKEAIDCYSRSIAFLPTAVTYANRAMAHLKIKRFEEAEDDCTEALNLDDRYIKAYSRRATARKEQGRLKESIEDAEFALRLEPNNHEIKKQYAEVKSLYEKEILKMACGSLGSSVQGEQKVRKSEAKVNGVQSIESGTQRTGVSAVEEDHSKNGGRIPIESFVPMEEIENKVMHSESRSEGQEVNGSHDESGHRSDSENFKRNRGNRKQDLKLSVQELACRAATRAMAEAAKSITPPSSAYQFEVCWQGFCGDRALQARLLKVTSPKALPQIFKNALSASLLIDIIKCVATFFIEDMDLAVKYVEHLTKVPRFSILIMCLSSADKADLYKLWDEVFSHEATPMEYAEILDNLRSKYCFNQL